MQLVLKDKQKIWKKFGGKLESKSKENKIKDKKENFVMQEQKVTKVGGWIFFRV